MGNGYLVYAKSTTKAVQNLGKQHPAKVASAKAEIKESRMDEVYNNSVKAIERVYRDAEGYAAKMNSCSNFSVSVDVSKFASETNRKRKGYKNNSDLLVCENEVYLEEILNDMKSLETQNLTPDELMSRVSDAQQVEVNLLATMTTVFDNLSVVTGCSFEEICNRLKDDLCRAKYDFTDKAGIKHVGYLKFGKAVTGCVKRNANEWLEDAVGASEAKELKRKFKRIKVDVVHHHMQKQYEAGEGHTDGDFLYSFLISLIYKLHSCGTAIANPKDHQTARENPDAIFNALKEYKRQALGIALKASYVLAEVNAERRISQDAKLSDYRNKVIVCCHEELYNSICEKGPLGFMASVAHESSMADFVEQISKVCLECKDFIAHLKGEWAKIK